MNTNNKPLSTLFAFGLAAMMMACAASEADAQCPNGTRGCRDRRSHVYKPVAQSYIQADYPDEMLLEMVLGFVYGDDRGNPYWDHGKIGVHDRTQAVVWAGRTEDGADDGSGGRAYSGGSPPTAQVPVWVEKYCERICAGAKPCVKRCIIWHTPCSL